MALRWCAAGIEADKQLRRVCQGHRRSSWTHVKEYRNLLLF
jgi:hypothetical protein